MKERLIQYLKKHGKTHSYREIAEILNILPGHSGKQKSDYVRKIYNRHVKHNMEIENPIMTSEYKEFLKWKQTRKQSEIKKVDPYLTGNPNNVLIIGDLHEPFTHSEYLIFCKNVQEQFQCGKVIFIGDIIDNHFSSYHETDADGLSASMELNTAVDHLKKWHHTFPNAIVTIGNHDRIIARKLYTSGVSSRWMKSLEEVLEVPTWTFVEEYIYNNVLYIHGEMGSARIKAKQEMISVVQGHNHTEAYTEFLCGHGGTRFAMQVGCGIDFNQYAFAYAKRGKKPVISCGVVINNTSPIVIPYGH